MREEKRAEGKAALRTRFRQVRASIPHRGAVDAAICARLGDEIAQARTVMLFWPLVARGEVDVRPLIHALLRRGAHVALPVVVPGDTPRLAARLFGGEADLVAGPFGLLEPAPDARLAETLDVIVVPALALGRDGSRLGYGGGYYDAFLATTPARRIGAVPHACLVDALPAEAHDARLDAVVTERETLRISRRAGP